MPQFDSDREAFDLACKAYQRWVKRKGLVEVQPSKDSDWEGDVYVLRNANDELARLSCTEGKFTMIES
ncbi:MAG: hypothetical protein KME18_07610 [Phormidium tanganyikae FI6-MK23]|jgi:hypothetical protein|nr:hypothetical protein [Phormidium tanganyikae FI6-MK23]